MLVKVTQDDIATGAKFGGGGPMPCPVRIALARALRMETTKNVRVGPFTWGVWPGDDWPLPRPLPKSAQEFIYSFDQGDPVAPFEFEVQP